MLMSVVGVGLGRDEDVMPPLCAFRCYGGCFTLALIWSCGLNAQQQLKNRKSPEIYMILFRFT